MRVLIVDDHPAVRLGMEALLGQAGGMEVVGGACEAEGALRLAAELRPDVVVLDLELRGRTDGAGVCRRLKAFPHPPRVLIHTAHNSPERQAAVVLAGADGYLNKGAEHVHLGEAIRRVAGGGRVWVTGADPGSVGDRLVEKLERAKLTARECEVYALLLKRYSNEEIARSLYTSLNTTKKQVSSVLRKLDARNRRDLLHDPREGRLG